jgi:GT2 family glycosyltransferase
MISLYLPYFNRPDLLNAAWDSIYETEGIEPVVIDNSPLGSSTDEAIHYGARRAMVRLSIPLQFGPSTHWMFSQAKKFGDPYWLVMHSDAEDDKHILPEFLNEVARRERDGEKWGVLFTFYDALAAYNTAAYEAVGGWDHHLPSYYGDCDYFRRLRLAGYPTIDTGLHVTHHGSSVIKSDPKTHFLSDQKCPGWNDYYVRKHGGPPDHETFTVFFNRPDLFS